MWTMIAISVFVYLVAGIAVAALVILIDGEPEPGDHGWIVALVLFWPILLLIALPLAAARLIQARRVMDAEKPPAYAEDEL